MKFLLPLVALVVAAAAHFNIPTRPVPFHDKAIDLAIEKEAGQEVQDRIVACWEITHCKHFLKRAMVKGNTVEKRYKLLLEALNSVEVKDWVKEIEDVTNPPCPIPTAAADPTADDHDE